MAGYVWLLRQTGADCGQPQKCFNFPMKIRNRTSGDLSDYQCERTAHRILKQRPLQPSRAVEKKGRFNRDRSVTAFRLQGVGQRHSGQTDRVRKD
jgi:hypothetical protein